MNLKNKMQDGSSFEPKPEREICYARGDHDRYRWYVRWFPQNRELETPDAVRELDSIWTAFADGFENPKAVRDFCRAENYACHMWNGYVPRYLVYVPGETVDVLFDFRIGTGDYNVYMHVYRKEDSNA